jgi:hypothetical protein
MTFPIFWSECVPGILDVSPASKPGGVSSERATIDLVRLFAHDRPSPDRRIVCRWRRQVDGRLACHWEPRHSRYSAALTIRQTAHALGE